MVRHVNRLVGHDDVIEESGVEKFPEVRMFTDSLRATASGKFGRAHEGKRNTVPPEERDGGLNFKIGE